jgi:hypothetical protein
MNARSVFDEFRLRGVSFQVVGGALKLNAPKGFLTPDRVELARSLKPDLIKLVASTRTPFVWRVCVDNHHLLVIDPHHESLESMQAAMVSKFGAGRVTGLRLIT